MIKYKLYQAFLIIITTLCLVSCNKKEDIVSPESIPELFSVVEKPSTIGEKGGEYSIILSASSSWTASVADEAKDWISITPDRGTANDNRIKVVVDENDSFDERNGAITFRSGDKSEIVTITQKQKDALTATSNKIEITSKGGNAEIEIKSNVSYTYSISENAKSWITENMTRGLTTSSLSFIVSENDDVSSREGVIELISDVITERVTIYQEGTEPVIVLSSKIINVASEGEEVKVELKSNTEYSLLMPDVDWIKECTTRAVSTYTHVFTVEANTNFHSRNANVVFADKKNGISDTLKIVQPGSALYDESILPFSQLDTLKYTCDDCGEFDLLGSTNSGYVFAVKQDTAGHYATVVTKVGATDDDALVLYTNEKNQICRIYNKNYCVDLHYHDSNKVNYIITQGDDVKVIEDQEFSPQATSWFNTEPWSIYAVTQGQNVLTPYGIISNIVAFLTGSSTAAQLANILGLGSILGGKVGVGYTIVAAATGITVAIAAGGAAGITIASLFALLNISNAVIEVIQNKIAQYYMGEAIPEIVEWKPITSESISVTVRVYDVRLSKSDFYVGVILADGLLFITKRYNSQLHKVSYNGDMFYTFTFDNLDKNKTYKIRAFIEPSYSLKFDDYFDYCSYSPVINNVRTSSLVTIEKAVQTSCEKSLGYHFGINAKATCSGNVDDWGVAICTETPFDVKDLQTLGKRNVQGTKEFSLSLDVTGAFMDEEDPFNTVPLLDYYAIPYIEYKDTKFYDLGNKVKLDLKYSNVITEDYDPSTLYTDKVTVYCSFNNIPNESECGIKYWNNNISNTCKIDLTSGLGYYHVVLSNLEPNTEYNYCAYARYNNKYYEGEVKSFTKELSLCPDSNHPHMIDLGLPSRTMWSCCNVGSEDGPEYMGYPYAWGEIDIRMEYDNGPMSYMYCRYVNPSQVGEGNYLSWCKQGYCYTYQYVYIGDNICGTNHDVAHVQYGSIARMPTGAEFQEICNDCKWTEYELLGRIPGYIVTGKNGNSIFIPEACDWYWAGDLQNKWSPTFMSPFALVPSASPYVFKSPYMLKNDHYMECNPEHQGYIRAVLR